jgi:hypothetical protein
VITPDAARAAEAEYAGRLLEREGIPMVLALVDETAPAEDGPGHAELLRAYREVLRPGAADDDAAALQDVLAVLSWVHRPGAGPVPAGPRLPSFGQHAAALAGGRFLRVINYHNTPAGSEEQLERELTAYLDSYDPVGVADLDAFLDTGRWPTDRPGFVAAFYDGYYNHATVAAPVCDRLGLRAWFLPPTAFLDTPTDGQHAFADRQDFWVLDEERDQARLAMSWADLAAIAERHEILAHTATHADRARALAEPATELAGPRDRIEQVTGRAPEAVVFRLGDPWDGSAAIGAAGYRFVVSNTAIQRIARP